MQTGKALRRSRHSPMPCVVVVAYVIAENAQRLRETAFRFFRDLFGDDALALGSLVVCTEATHRHWPSVVLAAFRAVVVEGDGGAAGRSTFDVAFPQVPGKRGYALCLHKRRRSEPESHWIEQRKRRHEQQEEAARREGAENRPWLTFEDIEHLVTAAVWKLLLRFQSDDAQHALRQDALRAAASQEYAPENK